MIFAYLLIFTLVPGSAQDAWLCCLVEEEDLYSRSWVRPGRAGLLLG